MGYISLSKICLNATELPLSTILLENIPSNNIPKLRIYIYIYISVAGPDFSSFRSQYAIPPQTLLLRH